jgi:glycosyltransferase involved in cell wall biosynthesis
LNQLEASENRLGCVWYVFPYAGGPGIGRFTRPYDLACRWLGRGVTTTVFASQHHHLLYDPLAALPAEMVKDGVRYRWLEGKPYAGNGLGRVRHMLGFARGLTAAMEGEAKRFGAPDAVIVSSPHPFPILSAARFARKHRVRLVFEVRDIWPLALKEMFGTPTWHPFYIALDLIERYAYRRADSVVSLLSAARDHMVARGLDPKKFRVIPNGAPDTPDGDVIIDEAFAAWLEKCRSEGRRIVGYAGSFGTPYAMISFIEIANRLSKAPDIAGKLAFLFVGDGVEREPLEHGLKALAVQGVVPPFLFTGTVTREAAAELMKRCDAGLILSKDMPLFRHGIAMNKLVEYMRLGKPILAAYDAGGDPIAESGCGWCVPPENAERFVDSLKTFATMPQAELAALGARGRAYFDETYDYASIARKYLGVLGLDADARSAALRDPR